MKFSCFLYLGCLVLWLGACSNPLNPPDNKLVSKIAGGADDVVAETAIISKNNAEIQGWFKQDKALVQNSSEASNLVQRYQLFLWQWNDEKKIDGDEGLSDEQLKDLCAGHLFKYKKINREQFIFEYAAQGPFNQEALWQADPPIALVACSLGGHPANIKVVLGFKAAAGKFTKNNFLWRMVFNTAATALQVVEQEVIRESSLLGSPANSAPANGDGYLYVGTADRSAPEEKNKNSALIELNTEPIEYQEESFGQM